MSMAQKGVRSKANGFDLPDRAAWTLSTKTYFALGLVCSLGKTPTVEQILQVIDVVYGLAVDGHNLLVKFHCSLQTTEESTGGYLQCLQRLVGSSMQVCCSLTKNTRIVTANLAEEVTTKWLYKHCVWQICALLAAIHNEERKRRNNAIRLGRQDNTSSRT